MLFYSSSPADQKAMSERANLENDTEKKRANIKEKTSEDSKEFNTLTSVRIKRKSLILAQDERWRRA